MTEATTGNGKDGKGKARRLDRRTLGKIVGYGVGGIGEDISYNLFYMFFIFFLTSVAGISPAAAGTISLVAVAWDAISDPIVGYLSDRCAGWKGFGKRGTFILMGAIPLGVSVFLLYNDVALGETGKIAYFVIINMLFWTFFTMVDIPYVAMAKEVTEDYDVKTRMRTSVSLFSYVGQLVLTFGILQFADYMANQGFSDVFSWRIIGAAMGFISTSVFMIVAVAMRGKELAGIRDEAEGREAAGKTAAADAADAAGTPKDGQGQAKGGAAKPKDGFVHTFLKLLKLHDYRMLLIMGVCYNLYIGVADSAIIYFQRYACGLTLSQTSVVETVALVGSMVLIVPVGEIIVKIGKRNSMLVAFAYMLLFSLTCSFIRPPMQALMVMDMGYQLATGIFWINIFAMNFDVSTIYEWKHGENREGTMVSICSFTNKMGVAVGMWINGQLMSALGIDPEAKTATEAMAAGMQTIYGRVPFFIAIAMIVACVFYRVRKSHVVALEESKGLREQGLEYSTDGFKAVL